MAGNTVYLNGLNNLNNCLQNSNTSIIPIAGLGNAFGLANNVNYLASKGGYTAPLQKALSDEIKKAAEKIIGKVPVNPNQPTNAMVNTKAIELVKAVKDCKTNCAPPVRTMPGVEVKIDPQTGKSNKKQLRKFNAAELNVMTRVVIEPLRKSLEATLQNLIQFPAQNAVYYNVENYKSFITELLQNWSNPTAVSNIIAKYKGKINNTVVANQLAMRAGLSAVNLDGLGDFLKDAADAVGDAVSNAGKWVGSTTSSVYDSVKAGVNVTFDMVKRAGAAIGEGIKNAAIFTVGMLQKYNPGMILARQAFRGLVAINFRGWASDMQGMRERGEENKIKDVWEGTFVGGNFGDLAAAINAGSGRDKRQAENASSTLTPETINTVEPFDWVGGQRDGLGFHTVAKHTLQAGDQIDINVLVGNTSYNGLQVVKYVGDDEGKNKDTMFVLAITAKGGASGTFKRADQMSRVGLIAKAGGFDLATAFNRRNEYLNQFGEFINPGVLINLLLVVAAREKANALPPSVIIPALPKANPVAVNPVVTPVITPVVNPVITPVLPFNPNNSFNPKATPVNPVTITPVLPPKATPSPVTVITQPGGKQVTLRKNFFTTMAQNANSGLKGLASLGEPLTAAALLAAATPVITVVTDIITKGKEVVKIVEDTKKLIDPFLPPNNGGGSTVPGGINPQPVSPPNPGGRGTPGNETFNPQPVDSERYNSPTDNANNGGGNTKILLISGAIAAVLVIALMSNSSAKPAKQLSGLDAAKKITTAKPKTVKTFKI